MNHPLWAGDDVAGATTPRRYLVMPSGNDPRLVIPTRPRRASSRILHALRDRSTLKARARTAGMEAAAFVNARSQTLPSPGIFDVVATAIGRTLDEVVIGVHLGPPRANRKPVLAVADLDGTLLAFVKCGVDPLTDALVEHEAWALQELAAASASGQLAHCTVPELLGSGRHASHAYAIQTPVPTSASTLSAHRASSMAVVHAQVDVSRVRPPTDGGDPADAIGQRWHDRSTSSADVVVGQFADVATTWVERVRGGTLSWGSWHGDWRTTNMSVTKDGCSVWDWERFSSGVPIGFDALHLFLTTRLPSVKTLATLPQDVFENAPRLLRPFGVTDRSAVELTVVGYFLELGGRYLDDDQASAGARLGKVGEWLLPTLVEFVHSRTSTRGGTEQ